MLLTISSCSTTDNLSKFDMNSLDEGNKGVVFFYVSVGDTPVSVELVNL
jgi:hypothetical protein